MTEPNRPRWKIWLKRIAVGTLFLVGLLLIVHAVQVWRANTKLEAKLAEIRAAGDPVTIADLAPEPVPNEENAAWWVEANLDAIQPFEVEYTEFCNAEIGEAYFDAVDEGRRPSDEQLAAVRKLLADHLAVVDAADRAAACDRYASLFDFGVSADRFLEEVVSGGAQRMRTFARLNELRVQQEIADGDVERAAQIALQTLKLGRLHRNQPTLVGTLVAIALHNLGANQMNHALHAGDVSDALRRRLDEELIRYEREVLLSQAIKQERALSQNIIESWGFWPLGRGAIWRVGVLEWYERELTLADMPWHEIDGRIGKGSEPTTDMLGGAAILTQNILPALQAGHSAHNRAIAVGRCLRILNELQRFAAENGREASGLAELDLPADVTIDPFTGDPLVVDRREGVEGNGGWWVYTVMENGKDDGGKFDDASDFGLAPIGRPE